MEKTACAKFFSRGQIDEDWVWIIANRVTAWVRANGGRCMWDVVWFASVHRGVLVADLSRKDFADLLVTLCPEVRQDFRGQKDNSGKLLASMYKYGHSSQFDDFDSLSEDAPAKRHVRAVDALFDEPIPANAQREAPYTMDMLLEQYLNEYVATGPLTRLIAHPTYGKYTATFAVEHFLSPEFMMNEAPSATIVFECIDERVTEEQVMILDSQYQRTPVQKVVVVSPYEFRHNTYLTAQERNIGLMLINLSAPNNHVKVILPRPEERSALNFKYRQMLTGKSPLTVPMVIDDVEHITTSLKDVLKQHGIPVKDDRVLAVRGMTHEEIEAAALQLVSVQVERYVALLKDCPVSQTPPVCAIDPFLLARRLGIAVVPKRLGKFRELAYLDIEKRQIVYAKDIRQYDPSIRFSVAHELGHDHLHNYLFADLLANSHRYLTPTTNADAPEMRQLDIQANRFASALLMPEAVIREMFRIYRLKELPQSAPKLVFSLSQRDVYLYRHIVGPVSRKLGVSMEAAKYRLLDLDLIGVTSPDVKRRLA